MHRGNTNCRAEVTMIALVAAGVAVLAIAGFAMGPILGLYFLAVAAPRVRQRAALLGFLTGIALLSYIALNTGLYWPWYAGCGAFATFAFGLLFSLFDTDPSQAAEEIE